MSKHLNGRSLIALWRTVMAGVLLAGVIAAWELNGTIAGLEVAVSSLEERFERTEGRIERSENRLLFLERDRSR